MNILVPPQNLLSTAHSAFIKSGSSRFKTFYMATLGCKVNQYESDGIAAELVAGGWHRSDNVEDAHVCIINTCAVTARAAMQSRQQIRSIIKANPDAKIIAAGCHAETAPDEIRTIKNVYTITGHQEKFKIAQMLLESESQLDISTKEDKLLSPFFKPAVTGSKTRAYLKIQDGCDAFCNYCIVPYARGRSRSMPPDDVVEHLLNLSSKGYKEAILTGIHVGAYGADLENEYSLTELMFQIDRLRPIHRVRLSSIEPKELTDEIINLACKYAGISRCGLFDSNSGPNSIDRLFGPCLCDHFHIPLQSGDDTILRRMGRPYNSTLFTNLINKIYNKIPTAAIGVDILEGFPGESDHAFENTLNLVEQLPISYLHVFPFSPRRRTPAFDYPDKVDSKVVKKRCKILRQLGLEKKVAFENRLLEKIGTVGNSFESVIQNKRDSQTGKLIAITSNYLSVLVDGGDNIKRQIVAIELEARDQNNMLIGKII